MILKDFCYILNNMVDVDFEEQGWQVPRGFNDEEKSGSKITNLILKTGLVKNPKQANYALAIVAVVFLIATYFIFRAATGGGSESVSNTVPLNMNNAGLPQP